MQEHQCSETNRLIRIEKLIDGNGNPGIVENVATLKERVNNMEADLNSLAVSYSALVKSQWETDVTERLKVERDKLKIEQSNKRMKYLMIISIIFGIAIPLTALIIEWV